jgi:hypothetical protein
VEERLLFDGVAGQRSNVAVRPVELAPFYKANPAHPGISFGDSAAVAASKALDSTVGELSLELRGGTGSEFLEQIIESASH